MKMDRKNTDMTNNTAINTGNINPMIVNTLIKLKQIASQLVVTIMVRPIDKGVDLRA